MRVLLWHGWLLEGSGSNIGTARVAQALRADGHDVLLVCQQRHPERYRWIDAAGTIGPDGLEASPTGSADAALGRCTMLRPDIGGLLPVFVVDEYEGFDSVVPFPELTDVQLEGYLVRNVEALRAAAAWHRPEVAIVGHAIPGAVIAGRALGATPYVAKTHGSDVEYALRLQARYRELAREGLSGARAVVGGTRDVLRRLTELVPGTRDRARVIPPGLDAHRFRPLERSTALERTAEALEREAAPGGRPSELDDAVARAIGERDGEALERLAHAYDQEVPDRDAADRLRLLAARDRPLVGTFGKLIPQKGVELVLAGAGLSAYEPDVLVVGFGLHREWLVALWSALRAGDRDAVAWLVEAGGMPPEVARVDAMAREDRIVAFTGRLDHRFAPGALAAMDVLVVPSILAEAFGMVAVEGAAAGALPLVARHSGLAEVAEELETAVGAPGLFSFEPGDGAVARLAAGIDRLLGIPEDERRELAERVAAVTARTWSWTRTARELLAAAAG